jgi:hypothetical protein
VPSRARKARSVGEILEERRKPWRLKPLCRNQDPGFLSIHAGTALLPDAGDMGADVIKVERPRTGDENRTFEFNRVRGVNASSWRSIGTSGA